MLNNSFLTVKGISEQQEKNLWGERIADLAAWHNHKKGQPYKAQIEQAQAELAAGNADYFYQQLPRHMHWRLFGDFSEQACYIDIEATGLYKHDTITTIALYDGREIKSYVAGQNLDDIKHDIKKYKTVVTFHGHAFDLPALERNLGLTVRAPHIDLFLTLKRMGQRGSLKRSYKNFGFTNNHNLTAVDGNMAVILWGRYKKTGEQKYLDALLCYNIEDVLMLENLMIATYNRKIAKIPIKIPPLPLKQTPLNPFTPDPTVIEEVKALNQKLNPKKPRSPRRVRRPAPKK